MTISNIKKIQPNKVRVLTDGTVAEMKEYPPSFTVAKTLKNGESCKNAKVVSFVCA